MTDGRLRVRQFPAGGVDCAAAERFAHRDCTRAERAIDGIVRHVDVAASWGRTRGVPPAEGVPGVGGVQPWLASLRAADGRAWWDIVPARWSGVGQGAAGNRAVAAGGAVSVSAEPVSAALRRLT
ncbi:MAG: hypothetical protein D6725_08595 [Planctomycetota bacterium]|nr:MAG: hypothetical protein D6725_08595 [Planctomycetota bacterium]